MFWSFHFGPWVQMWLSVGQQLEIVLSDGCFFTHSPKPLLSILPERDDI